LFDEAELEAEIDVIVINCPTMSKRTVHNRPATKRRSAPARPSSPRLRKSFSSFPLS